MRGLKSGWRTRSLSPGPPYPKSLSGRFSDGRERGEFTPDDETSGQLYKAQIQVLTFLPASLDAPKTVEPTVADFNDPPPRRMTFRIARRRDGVFFRCFLRDVCDQAFVDSQLTTRGRVVPTVQQQMSLFLLFKSRNSDNDGIKDIHQHLTVVTICSTEYDRERNAFSIGQQGAFAPCFASVSGIAACGLRRTSAPLLPNGALTMLASAACHAQSIPTSWSYSSSKMAHAARRQSCSTQAQKRSCTVDFGP